MENKEYQFVQVPINLFILLDNNCRSMLFTLIQLSTYYAEEDGWFFRTYADLEAESNLSQNLVGATIQTLFNHHLIEAKPTGQGKGKNPNYYKVNFEEFRKYEEYSIEDCMKNPDLKIRTVEYKGSHFKLNLVREVVNNVVTKVVKSDNNINNIDNIYNKNNIYNIDNNNNNILDNKNNNMNKKEKRIISILNKIENKKTIDDKKIREIKKEVKTTYPTVVKTLLENGYKIEDKKITVETMENISTVEKDKFQLLEEFIEERFKNISTYQETVSQITPILEWIKERYRDSHNVEQLQHYANDLINKKLQVLTTVSQ